MDDRTRKLHRYVWNAMKFRCYNPKCKQYADYDGRGITVCDRWLKSFDDWLADMGPRPNGYQIDRINNDGNYEPSNCRWVPPRINQSNKRPIESWDPSIRKLSPTQVEAIKKDTRTLRAIAADYGIHFSWISRIKNDKFYKDLLN